MARVRLLRQQLEDYNKQAVASGKEYDQRYADYQTQFNAYGEATNQYNAGVEAFNAAGARAGDIFQNEQGTLSQYDNNGNPLPFMDNQAPMGDESGGSTTFSKPYKNDQGLWVYDTTYTASNGRTEDGQVVPGQTYTQTNPIAVKAYHPGVAPTAPAEPAPPTDVRPPNFTQSDLAELRNPSQDAAGLQMMMNKGLIGKSELADNERSKGSAFADPNDPNNLKDSGILARVLGGQL